MKQNMIYKGFKITNYVNFIYALLLKLNLSTDQGNLYV